jgi:hypothetical protein
MVLMVKAKQDRGKAASSRELRATRLRNEAVGFWLMAVRKSTIECDGLRIQRINYSTNQPCGVPNPKAASIALALFLALYRKIKSIRLNQLPSTDSPLHLCCVKGFRYPNRKTKAILITERPGSKGHPTSRENQ